MKKLLLVLVAILSVIVISACEAREEREEREEPINFDNYDYYLLIVVSRQRLNQDNYLYVLHEAGKPLTTDNFTYESDELWSVGEFVIAIELDEKGNVYFTDLNVTTDGIVNQPNNEEYIEQIIDDFELVIELQQHYYQEKITSHNFGDWLQINYPALYERLLNYF